MTLGQIIEALEAAPQDMLVKFDNGHLPYRFYSWRGVYAELTLHDGGDWEGSGEDFHYKESPQLTVKELLEKALAADGATFEGWKGGDYVMDLSTPVWADPEGECLKIAIIGTRIDEGEFVFMTTYIGEYY